MNKKLRGFILVTLAISLGAFLTAQSPSLPGIQGFYYVGKIWKAVSVDKNGALNVNATVTPGGTQDVNLTKVGGTAVVTGGIAGSQGVGGTTAVGGAATNPETTGFRDDSGNVLADYGFPDENNFTVTGTDVVVVTGVASTKTYLKQIAVTLSSAQTVTIQQGTGTTCGTNTATLYGPFPATQGFVLDFDSKGALHTTVNARDLCIHLGASATAGGGAIYGTH